MYLYPLVFCANPLCKTEQIDRVKILVLSKFATSASKIITEIEIYFIGFIVDSIHKHV